MNQFGITWPFADSRRPTSNLALVALALIYIAIYIKDIASSWMNNSTALYLLVAGLLCGFTHITLEYLRRRTPEPVSFWVLVSFAVAWVSTLAITGQPNFSSYYLAIPCAFVVVNTNPRLFCQMMLGHFVLTLGIEALEYLTGQYLFVYQASDGTALDETLFGGSLDIFRAKGMFQGPLSAVAFALWIAFLARGSLMMAAGLFFCAFFASGRLGMLSAAALLAVRFLINARSVSVTRLIPMSAALIVLAALLFLYSDENRLYFISTALDLDNDQNESRYYFWLTALAYFLSYSPLEMVFGNFGFIFGKEGGTENDFLRLLLDCGFVGFAIFAGAIGAMIVKAVRNKDHESLFIALLIIVLMNIFPFVQSLSSALLFWVYALAILQRRPTAKPVQALISKPPSKPVIDPNPSPQPRQATGHVG